MGNILKCEKVTHSVTLEGCYRSITEKKSGYLKVNNDMVTYHEAGDDKPFDRIKIEYGKYGKVHHKIEEITGNKNYNFKLIINSIEQEGLINEDCDKFYMVSELDPNLISIHTKISQVIQLKLYLYLLHALTSCKNNEKLHCLRQKLMR